MDYDETHEHVQAFAEEFAKLVRKFSPTFADGNHNNLLVRMQDQTSCFSPYVWSEKFDLKELQP